MLIYYELTVPNVKMVKELTSAKLKTVGFDMQNDVTENDKTNVMPDVGIRCDVREVEIIDVDSNLEEELLIENREQRHLCTNNKSFDNWSQKNDDLKLNKLDRSEEIENDNWSQNHVSSAVLSESNTSGRIGTS